MQGNHTKQARKAEERSRRMLLEIFFAMVKRCCAVECANMAVKVSNLGFHRFPADPHRAYWRKRWIAGVRREIGLRGNTENICVARSKHLVCDDPLSLLTVSPRHFIIILSYEVETTAIPHVMREAKRRVSKLLEK